MTFRKSFGGLLAGCDQLVLTERDFANQRHVQSGGRTLAAGRAKVTRIIAEAANNSRHEEDHGQLTATASVSYGTQRVEATDRLPLSDVTKGVIYVDFFVRGRNAMQRVSVTLTEDARARMQVWADALLQRGCIKE